MKVQIAAVNFTDVPFATRNFKSAVGVGDFCHRAKNPSGIPPFSCDQIASNCGISPASASPNTSIAAVFARNTTQLAFNSNDGHAAPSKPNTTSGFIQINRSIVAYRSFEKIQGMTNAHGRSFRTGNSLILFNARLSATSTLAPGAYSASNCRHAPQGIGPPGARATTATATNFFLPLVSALNSATRSAQHVKP